MMYNALVLDVGNLKYRYLTDSDTILLKNRQNPGEDRRRDEWLTECGLEARFPESHMYFKNVQTISRIAEPNHSQQSNQLLICLRTTTTSSTKTSAPEPWT